ncbi:MAG: hypothetical protein M3Q65_06845 [Chloroflexota bacterium]|nr:hypothetical protein [Chloroflexota bacterium]
MAKSHPFSFSPPVIRQPAVYDKANDTIFACRWLLETWLVRVRWCVVPLGLIALPFFPTVSWPLTLLLAMGLALGNAWLA